MALLIHYRPAGASPDMRVEASVWSDGAGGSKHVVPLDNGPRRLVRVKNIRGVWTEQR